jgi:hypothetical protein
MSGLDLNSDINPDSHPSPNVNIDTYKIGGNLSQSILEMKQTRSAKQISGLYADLRKAMDSRDLGDAELEYVRREVNPAIQSIIRGLTNDLQKLEGEARQAFNRILLDSSQIFAEIFQTDSLSENPVFNEETRQVLADLDDVLSYSETD